MELELAMHQLGIRGKLYNAYGEMVASVMQEGLTRYQRDFTPPAR